MKKDIVYVLKSDIKSEELLYSIRSVCENFDFNKIWFFGGCPDNIFPDYFISFPQKGSNKWLKTRSTLELIFSNPQITNDFYLFNDDFFILHPYNQDIPIYRGTLKDHADAIFKQYPNSAYGERLKKAEKALININLTTKSYECHTPMLVNRSKGFRILVNFGKDFIFRSTYGNFYQIGGILQEDVKITNMTDIPTEEQALVSTEDKSFKKGKVGEYIRELFPNQCRYEFPRYQPKDMYIPE